MVYLIDNFLIPALNKRTFGELLKWEDETNGTFNVFWTHKSRRKWEAKTFKVFTAWDHFKGRTDEKKPNYYTNSKTRFRTALNRLSGKIEKLPDIGHYHRYRLKNFSVNGKSVRKDKKKSNKRKSFGMTYSIKEKNVILKKQKVMQDKVLHQFNELNDETDIPKIMQFDSYINKNDCHDNYSVENMTSQVSFIDEMYKKIMSDENFNINFLFEDSIKE